MKLRIARDTISREGIVEAHSFKNAVKYTRYLTWLTFTRAFSRDVVEMYGPKRGEKFLPNRTYSRRVLVLHKNAGWSRQPSIARRLQGGQNFRSEGRRVRCPTPFIFRERGKVCRAALRNGSEERHLLFVISGVHFVVLR